MRRRRHTAHLPELPTASGKSTIVGYRRVHSVPSRPSKPPALAEAQARAARLRRPRKPLLKRPVLHRHHEHAVPDAVVIDLTSWYVANGRQDILEIDLPPWQRQVALAALDQIASTTPEAKMAHHARIGDVAHQLGTTA